VANRVSDKLTPLHDKIYCCRSGSAADTQALSDYARRALSDHALVKGAAPTVSAAAHVFRKMCYSNKDRLLAGIIVAGWDAVQGGQVYEIPLGGTCVRGNVALGGSGSTYIHGFVDSAYRPGAWRPRAGPCCARARAPRPQRSAPAPLRPSHSNAVHALPAPPPPPLLSFSRH
jgi:20S proteasome subunit beta 1